VHHVELDRWSRGASPLHRRDPRAKIVPLLVFLIVLATAHRQLPVLCATLLVMLCASLWWARIPVTGAFCRAALVLPFTLVFAAASWLAGDPQRAVSLTMKSYLSALAVLVVVSTTPLPVLLRGIELLGAPRFLLMVAQFLYRYLFVISEQAQHMGKAAAARGGSFRSASGALAVLFARSHEQAARIHRAMLARGFEGSFHPLAAPHFHAADVMMLIFGSAAPIALRAALERVT
jgi:cobalt/nickel transport system permease protein